MYWHKYLFFTFIFLATAPVPSNLNRLTWSNNENHSFILYLNNGPKTFPGFATKPLIMCDFLIFYTFYSFLDLASSIIFGFVYKVDTICFKHIQTMPDTQNVQGMRGKHLLRGCKVRDS